MFFSAAGSILYLCSPINDNFIILLDFDNVSFIIELVRRHYEKAKIFD